MSSQNETISTSHKDFTHLRSTPQLEGVDLETGGSLPQSPPSFAAPLGLDPHDILFRTQESIAPLRKVPETIVLCNNFVYGVFVINI